MAERLLFKVASPNRAVRFTTAMCLSLSAACVLGGAGIALLGPHQWWVGAVILGLVPLVTVYNWAYVPVAYELNDEAIVVHCRLASPATIPLRGLRDVRPVDLAQWTAKRVWGNSGLFAYVGLFSDEQLGRFHASVRDTDRIVLLEGETIRSWVISPADVVRFVEETKQRLPAAS